MKMNRLLLSIKMREKEKDKEKKNRYITLKEYHVEFIYSIRRSVKLASKLMKVIGSKILG